MDTPNSLQPSQFLVSISHELKNQLAGILSLSQMIKEEFFGEFGDKNHKKEYIEAATDINNVAKDMLEFVNDLMDEDQNKSGNFSINLQETDVIPLVNHAVKIGLNSAIRKKINIIFNHEDRTLKAYIDPRRMKQILINLISNAVKYSKENSLIIIDVHSEEVVSQKMPKHQLSTLIANNNSKGSHSTPCYIDQKNHLVISIRDQGIGMDGEEMKKALAGEGSSIDKSHLNESIDSHGIGIPLTKRLVELQGGIMKIQSKKGLGTEVILKFNS